MTQFSKDTDSRLEFLEKQLAETVADKEKAEARYDALFLQVFHEFDSAGIESSADFIASDGFKLGRIVPEMQPVVNQEKLFALINDNFDMEEGRKLWNRVTVQTRTILQNKLAEELKRNTKLAVLIDDAGDVVFVPTRKPSRIRKLATAKEKQNVAITQALDAAEEGTA